MGSTNALRGAGQNREEAVGNDPIVRVGDRDGSRLQRLLDPTFFRDEEEIGPVEGAVCTAATFKVFDDLKKDRSCDVD